MAGVPGHKMRLFVGIDEFTSQMNALSRGAAVAEIDDSNAGDTDMKYIVGQSNRTLTFSGRWTGTENEIDEAIETSLTASNLVASSADGVNYKIGEHIRSTHEMSGSLGDRWNVSVGLRLAEGAPVLAKEVFRETFETTAASTNINGDALDLGSAAASAERTWYVYYIPDTGAVPAVSMALQDSANGTSGWTAVETNAFTTVDLTDDDPAQHTHTDALRRYIRFRATITGTGRTGTIVALVSDI